MSDVYEGRNAAILRATIDGTEYNDPPQSVIEGLLIELKEAIEAGGGGGGTTNYNALSNKPQINSVTLQGNESLADLGIQPELTFDSTPTAGSSNPVTSGGVKTALDAKQDTLTIDSALSGTSENPVQNKVIKGALDNIYSKAEVNSLIAALTLLSFEVVATLPTTDISPTTIYLVPNSQSQSQNVYDEFIYINNAWENIGSTAIDLSNYYNKSQTDILLATKQATLTFDSTPTAGSNNPVTSGGVKTALDAKQDTLTIDSALSGTSENPVRNKVIKAALDNKQDTLTIDSALSLSSENPVQNKVLTLILGDKLSVVQTMGTASATLLGAIVLYDGATSASYTKGHLYECQEVTPATDPATYQWVDLSVQFDSALSSTSENAVQNKVIYEQIYQKLYSTIAGRTQNAKGSMELYSVDLDTIVTSGFYNAMTCTHAPASYCALIVCGYYMSGYCFQQAVDINTGIIYTRVQTGGTWSSWEAINNSLVHA